MMLLLWDTPASGIPSKHSALLLLALAALAHSQETTAAETTAAEETASATDTAADTTAEATDVALTDLPDLSAAPSVGEETTSSTSATETADSTASIFHLTGVPTIAGYGIPTQVVPWTAGAPYMQTSQLPEGTVFIIVGAVLGFLGAAVLAWRGMVAWSLHRSVKRAQLGTQYNDSMLKLAKPGTSGGPGVGGNLGAMGSTLSLERLSAPAGKLSKTQHGRNGSAAGLLSGTTSTTSAARNSSLFFSPTAGAGAHHASPSAAHTQGANRASAYLPAGYYAAPNSAPAQGAKHASVGGLPASRLSSLNPNHPSNRGYAPPSDYAASGGAPSPPDSPLPRPSTGGTLGTTPVSRNGRASGAEAWSNLNVPGGAPAGQRAPSANLEDLFEHHGNGMRGY